MNKVSPGQMAQIASALEGNFISCPEALHLHLVCEQFAAAFRHKSAITQPILHRYIVHTVCSTFF